MRRRPPRSTRTDTLFPYATLFRSIHPGKDNLEAARKCVNQMLAADPNSADALAAAVFVNYGLSAADPKHSKKWRDIALQQAKQAVLLDPYRSDERRVGKECVRTCRSRWSAYN